MLQSVILSHLWSSNAYISTDIIIIITTPIEMHRIVQLVYIVIYLVYMCNRGGGEGIEVNLLSVQCHVFADNYSHVNHGFTNIIIWWN